ncbi:GntR family transcriptional regulator [Biformimicrobium ophioploci]|uniref:GntR family transcriptional regulator n=1 Tax=Biformimicrobium ophioploci TaxID=3036711 RepID=A0ABQ6LWI4_9GAMM|nr:GntR family transcriptional regulator [Microbulbifer sp. NKW57]GMG86462.1 GntR family transcriptional regulator [Microbulbifer sp. NKW57]
MSLTRKQQRLQQELDALIEHQPPGSRLPGERELSAKLAVSRDTLRRALKQLEERHRIEIRQGAGIFVRARPLASQLKLMSFSEEMQQQGLTPSSQLLAGEIVQADVKLAGKLQVAPGAELLRVRRLRLANDTPVAIEQVYLPRVHFPGLAPSELASGSLYELLYDQYEITAEQAAQQISATVVDDEEAALLDVAPFSPALLAERTVSDEQGRIIEFAKSLYRADKYRFNVLVQRQGTRLAPAYEQ